MDFASKHEQEVWNALRARAEGALSPGFAAGVIRAAAIERRRQRMQRLAFGSVAAMLCLAYVLLSATRADVGRKREALWLQYQQGQWLALKTL